MIIPEGTSNTRYEAATACTIVYEKFVIKSTGSVNAPLECYRYTNYTIYYINRFHIYRNFIQNSYSYALELSNQSIKDNSQCTSVIWGFGVHQGRQGGWGHTASSAASLMFSEGRAHLTQTCNK